MEKIISHLRWFFVVVFLGVFGLLTVWYMYPLAALVEKILPNNNPFWWWLDDQIEDENSNKDYIIWVNNNGGKSIYNSYFWHTWRNRIWNLFNSVKPENARDNCKVNNEVIVEIIQDTLHRNGEKVDIHGLCLEMSAYKWIDKNGEEGWQVNQGEGISVKFSTQGTLEIWYRANGKLYYRYSVAKISKQIGFKKKFPFVVYADHYFQFKMGANEKRYVLTMKRHLIKK